jgi:hypothetical protein
MVYFFTSLQEGRNVLSIILVGLMLECWSPEVSPIVVLGNSGTPSQSYAPQLRKSLLPSRGKESVTAASREVFAAVERGMGAGTVGTFSDKMDARVYMQLRGAEGGYHSATQAYYILSAFFKAHKPISVLFTTYGETDGAPYATGAAICAARGVREDLQVYVALHLSGDRWVITHLNIY